MPVIHTRETALHETNRPDWCQITGAGFFRIPADGSARFDRHFHDYHEYWLVSRGKAKVWSESREHYVGPGDILCTRAGDEHDLLEVYEELEGFWFEEAGAPGGRVGHLHRDEQAARGHAVPGCPLPPDFPK